MTVNGAHRNGRDTASARWRDRCARSGGAFFTVWLLRIWGHRGGKPHLFRLPRSGFPASDRGACPEGRGSRIGKRVAEVSGWEVRPSASVRAAARRSLARRRLSGRRRRRTPRDSPSSERPRKAGVFGVFGSRFAGRSRRSPGVGRWVMRVGGVATVLRLSGLGEGTGVARDVPAAVQCRRRARGVARVGKRGTFCMVAPGRPYQNLLRPGLCQSSPGEATTSAR